MQPRDALPEWFAEWEQCVDGELHEQSRQELFQRIDQQPGGWKTCAMSLLWEHSLRREVRRLIEADCRLEALGASERMSICPSQPDLTDRSRAEGRPSFARRATRRWMWGLAVAASLVLAFSLGWLVSARSDRGSGDRVSNSATAQTPAEDVRGRREPVDRAALAALANGKAGPAERTADADSPKWQWITVPLPRGNSSRLEPTRVPFREVSTVDEAFDDQLSAEETAQVQEWIRAVSSHGGTVEMQRRWVTVELGPDAFAVVPIDQWDIELPETESLGTLFDKE